MMKERLVDRAIEMRVRRGPNQKRNPLAIHDPIGFETIRRDEELRLRE